MTMAVVQLEQGNTLATNSTQESVDAWLLPSIASE